MQRLSYDIMAPQHYSASEPETSGDDGASIDLFADGRTPAPGNRGVSIPIQRIADVVLQCKACDVPVPRFDSTINYDRMSHEKGSKCLMCGGRDVLIPKQNKDVCRVCDSCVWLHRPTRLHLKWCKGCKRFNSLQAFKDKPEATKCGKCRERGRRGYEKRRRRLSVDVDSDTDAESVRKDSMSSDGPAAPAAVEGPAPGPSHSYRVRTGVAGTRDANRRGVCMPSKPEPLVKHAAHILMMIRSDQENKPAITPPSDPHRAELKRKRSQELPPMAQKRPFRPKAVMRPLGPGLASMGLPANLPTTGFTSADLPMMQSVHAHRHHFAMPETV